MTSKTVSELVGTVRAGLDGPAGFLDRRAGLDALMELVGLLEQERDSAGVRVLEVKDAHDYWKSRAVAALALTGELIEVLEDTRVALEDPAMLHWLGSTDVLDVDAATARAAQAIGDLRSLLTHAQERLGAL